MLARFDDFLASSGIAQARCHLGGLTKFMVRQGLKPPEQFPHVSTTTRRTLHYRTSQANPPTIPVTVEETVLFSKILHHDFPEQNVSPQLGAMVPSLPPNCEHRFGSPSSETASDSIFTRSSLSKDEHKDTAIVFETELSQVSPHGGLGWMSWCIRLSNTISNGFCLEIISSLSSIALTIALIIVLYVYDDRVLPSWPWGITVRAAITSPAYTLIHQLNALVSLLVTAAKSMLLLAVAEGISQYKWLHYISASPRPLSNMQTFDSASRGPWGAIKMLASIRPGYDL